MTKVLFVTWDGPDSPYLETLFLPVFRGLRSRGFEFDVLQFTWNTERYVRAQEEVARRSGIGYRHFPVLRGAAIPSAIAMISAGALLIRARAKRFGADVVFPRSIFPAAMALAARFPGEQRLVFDADGLPADERVEFTGWNPRGATYRVWREIESQSVRAAGAVVTRTEAAKEILVDRAGAGTSGDKIFVIPNARDESLFTPGSSESRGRIRRDWGVRVDAPCVLFVGSIGPQYYPREMLLFYERVVARRQDARLVLLTHQLEEARAAVREARLDERYVVLRTVAASAMAEHIAAADLGLALRAPTFSQRAVSPVKIAEYLLCGVPVVSTPVGDVLAQIGEGAGFVIEKPGPAELERAAQWFVHEVLLAREAFRTRCREAALRRFALSGAVDRYASAFEYAARVRSLEAV